jgi:hypothetical protein
MFQKIQMTWWTPLGMHVDTASPGGAVVPATAAGAVAEAAAAVAVVAAAAVAELVEDIFNCRNC